MIHTLVCSFLLLQLCSSALITVNSSKGAVQGFDHDFGNDRNQKFYVYGQVFLGIPFAKAPVGERRFTLPEPICQYNNRNEEHDATYYRPRCWQGKDSMNPASSMDEDCLYLNVITPNVSGKYPVMVYIHGGTFTTGGADIYHWKGAIRSLVSRGVVVVTIQYRIGVIGFFTTFTERFPPNRGMFDQIAALEWVNEEIANFGGDPSRITLFGQSAGATSVSDLSLSPLARGLFHQLIQTSGAAMMEVESIDDPRATTHQDRARQICQIDSTDWGSTAKDQALTECLLQATPQELIAFELLDMKSWNPVIDGVFLPDYPVNLARKRPNYPVLIGDMMEEAAHTIPGMFISDLSNVTKESMRAYLQTSWYYLDKESATNLADMTIYLYADGEIPSDEDHIGWAKLMSQLFSEFVFSSHLLSDAKWHLKKGNDNVWLFTFNHRSLLQSDLEVDGWIPILHGADLPYLWFYSDKWESKDVTTADLAVADHFGKLWTDFAKNGELPFPRAGEAMNYFVIGEKLTKRSNWRPIANYVFNELVPNYMGSFPPIKMSDESQTKMDELGEKMPSKWNARKCTDV